MDAMRKEVEPIPAARARLHVEDPAMNDVLNQRPDEHAKQEAQDHHRQPSPMRVRLVHTPIDDRNPLSEVSQSASSSYFVLP